MSVPAAKIGKFRRWKFIQTSFKLGLTAFGGPQLHIPLFVKEFVEKQKFCDKTTLLDINAFCSILPGPSTTQTITALGFRLGGPRLAFLSLLAWLLPGAIILSIITLSPRFLAAQHLRFIQPMVAAFMVFAAANMFKLVHKQTMIYVWVIVVGISGYFIHSPWIYPIAIIIGAILSSNFGNREYTKNLKPFGKIKLANLILYLLIFITVGLSGALFAESIGRPLVLFENSYRMGSLAFGGGNTLAAMAVDQYHYHTNRLSIDEINVGIGLVQAMPGPNFNFSAYLNGIAMKNYGYDFYGQLLGCFIGVAGIFLPGTLLVFFGYPVWDRIRTYPIVQRSLDGIFAASVGFIVSAALVINSYYFQQSYHSGLQPSAILIYATTLFCLFSGKVASPVIVIGTILAGVILPL